MLNQMPRASRQLGLTFRTWGGARRGAGRKPTGERAGVSHVSRPVLDPRHPAHVTLKVGRGIPSLRSQSSMRVLQSCFVRGRDRFGFRLVHYAVQENHLHFVVEAENKKALSRGLQGLSV